VIQVAWELESGIFEDPLYHILHTTRLGGLYRQGEGSSEGEKQESRARNKSASHNEGINLLVIQIRTTTLRWHSG